MTDKKKKEKAQKKLNKKLDTIRTNAVNNKKEKLQKEALNNDDIYQELLRQKSDTAQNFKEKADAASKTQAQLNQEGFNGQDIWNSFAKEGAKSDYINQLKDRTDISKDEIEQMSQDITDYSDAVQSLTQQRLDIFDKVNSCLDQWVEKFDKLIEKQEHLNNLTQGYRNIIDIIGAVNFSSKKSEGIREEEKSRIGQPFDDSAQANAYTAQQRIITAQRKSQVASMKNYQKEYNNVQRLMNGNGKVYDYTDEATGKTIKVSGEGIKGNLENAQTKLQQAIERKDQKAIDTWQQDVDFYQDMMDRMETKSQELMENKQSMFEQALQTSEEQWEMAMEEASRKFGKAIAGNAGTLDLLNAELERQSKISEAHVKDYEKMYQLRQMELDAQKSIDEANDPKIKKELLEIQQKITQAQNDGKKASQYELDYLRQQLELKQAEAALEDAQKAKSQVSLTRDSEGNYGYVYTADEGDVAEAEKNYADKIYEMQKSNQEYIDQMSNEYLTLEQEMLAKIEEVNNNKELTKEQRDLEIENIKSDYGAMLQEVEEQLTYSFKAAEKIYGEYANTYATITGDWTAINGEHVESFDQTTVAIATGYESLIDMAKAFNDGTTAYLADTDAAYDAYVEGVDEAMTAAGTSMDTYVEDAGKAAEQNQKDVEAIGEKMEEMGETADEEFGKTLAAAQDFEESWNDVLGEMQDAVENLTEAITALKEAFEDMDDLDSVATGTQTVKDTTGNNDRYKTLKGNKKGRRGKKLTSTKQVNKLNSKYFKNTKTYEKYKRKYTRDGSRFTRKEKRKALTAAKRAVKRNITKAKKQGYKGVVLKYDTGGYTGSWAGNEGRMAMLHQKELVLNQSDTDNILSAVGMIRDIASRIDMNALAASGAFASGIGGISNVGAGAFEQNVHITAEFPNATDRNEIFEAFKNITNLASQYANR